jgi:hypothetical protein
MQRFFDIFPLLLIPIVIYAIFALMAGTGNSVDTFATDLEKSTFVITMPSGAPWGISGGNILVGFGILVFFYESIRGVAASPYAIVHHTISVLLSLGAMGAFFLFENFSTSTFFLLMMMCVLDMVAGVIANIAQSGGWHND